MNMLSHLRLELLIKIFFISIVYFISAKLVLPLSLVESGSVFAIWPPTGVALACLLLFGYRIWLGIFIGALAINMTLTPFLPSLLIAITNTLGPIFSFWFLKKYNSENFFYSKKTMALFFLAILLASTITATGGSFSLFFNGYISDETIVNVWTSWFLGDFIGFILISSLIVSFHCEPSLMKKLFSIEGFFMFTLLIIVSLVIFGPFVLFNLIEYPVVYFLLPPLIWTTLRFEQSISVIFLFIVSIASIYGTIAGYGPFLRDNPNHSLLLLQSFIITLAVTILIISAIFNESKRAQNELKENEENLLIKIQEGIEKNRLQHQQMLQQSRLAQMGELINMIAHQWRQPLGAIASMSINLKIQSDLKKYDLNNVNEAKEYENSVNKCLNEIDKLVKNLTITIDDFRSFYKSNKESVKVKIEEVVEKSLNIIKSSLTNNHIKIIREYEDKDEIQLYDNQIMHVILNILKNAQDNFIEKNIKEPYIRISIKNKTISICDNGGGIDKNIIDKIFDPYFSTKDQKNGTGLGLYMSKTMIEEHHNGKLIAKNIEDGVCFIIELGRI